MFDQLKQLKKIKDMQSALEKERIEVEKDGVKLVINGKLEVEGIILNPELSKDEQERAIKDCFNEAIKKIQMIMAKKMFQ
ncbi:YbaB/EbfC family nucleoid-associated protein [Patescibacteria group bacterium]|nr:YbaB/EbfC family nucleoid-associated protein [Patescibacteria group bacterium]